MSPENFEETELSLGLPGESRPVLNNYSSRKRGFEESVELTLGSSSNSRDLCSKICDDVDDLPKNEISSRAKPPSANDCRAQSVGWPPVKSSRKSHMMMMKSSRFVKVAVDGAPYLRKVDLEMFSSYQQLLSALEDMFSCLSITKVAKEKILMDPTNGVEYEPTYEDKDGDWMLVGDVPWKMFVESCKRIRLMKSSEAIGLDPRTSLNCSSTIS